MHTKPGAATLDKYSLDGVTRHRVIGSVGIYLRQRVTFMKLCRIGVLRAQFAISRLYTFIGKVGGQLHPSQVTTLEAA